MHYIKIQSQKIIANFLKQHSSGTHTVPFPTCVLSAGTPGNWRTPIFWPTGMPAPPFNQKNSNYYHQICIILRSTFRHFAICATPRWWCDSAVTIHWGSPIARRCRKSCLLECRPGNRKRQFAVVRTKWWWSNNYFYQTHFHVVKGALCPLRIDLVITAREQRHRNRRVEVRVLHSAAHIEVEPNTLNKVKIYFLLPQIVKFGRRN